MPRSNSTTPRRRSVSTGKRTTRSSAKTSDQNSNYSNTTGEEEVEEVRVRSRSRSRSRQIQPVTPISRSYTTQSASKTSSFKIIQKEKPQTSYIVSASINKNNTNTFYQLVKKNAYLILGLFLFGIGSMILLTQLEPGSPLIRFLEGSFDSFQKSEYASNIADNLSTYSSMGNIKEIKLRNEHFSGFIASLGAVVILIGGYLYFVSTTIEVENLPVLTDSRIERPLSSITSGTTAHRPPGSKPAPSTGAYELPGDSISSFMAQVYRYQQLVRERSLRFNIWLFAKYMQFHWFRIASACVVMLLFWLTRYAYIERVFVRSAVVTVGVNLLRIVSISLVVILVSLGLWYYIRYRNIKSRVIVFLAHACKRRLEQLYRQDGTEEYPVDFMQEELVELVSAALLHAQQLELSSPTTTTAPTRPSISGSNSNSLYPAVSDVSITSSSNTALTPSTSLSRRSVSTPSTQRSWLGWLLGYKRAVKARYTVADIEMLAIPHDLLTEMKATMVRKYWKEIQVAVEKGK